ncbi:unnamed protein product [Caenorhabditis auriculariae]|uniref:C3H1-type domain-containing protein n=1 Tax=Caenorhabditis auriculariae TaxID=2777116 RepID=A0A8S1H9I6_9PELO|nr:unnamed protein product [Caenorhabditis auriculariae]
MSSEDYKFAAKLAHLESLETSQDDEMYEVESRGNVTCPPDIINQFNFSDLNESMAREMDELSKQDRIFHSEMRATINSAIIAQDPCTLPDDVREELMKQKRKDEAYKTALCESFRKTKTCAYGENCRFAHGVDELRLPPNPRGRNHPKYKTVLCDKFSTTGNCKYGIRCQFIHKIVNPLIVAQMRPDDFLQQSFVGRSYGSTAPHQYGRQVDLNQSMPHSNSRRDDMARAFARAVDHNPHISRLARVVETRNPFNNFQKGL